MIKFFLKIKHWQLFALMIIVPLVIMISGNPFSLIARIGYGVVAVGSYFGWLYSMGIFLNKKLPNGIVIKQTYFKLAFLILILFFIGSVLFEILNGKPKHNHSIILLLIIIFLYFWVFYIFYFVAKSLKTVELKRVAVYKDYADAFFSLWIYPIGLWTIQPRINSLFKEEEMPTS